MLILIVIIFVTTVLIIDVYLKMLVLHLKCLMYNEELRFYVLESEINLSILSFRGLFQDTQIAFRLLAFFLSRISMALMYCIDLVPKKCN